MRIWIDLTNSPHVLVFRPLIERFRAAGDEVEITARDYAQTLQLCKRFDLDVKVVGRHGGGRLLSKAAGMAGRSRTLFSWARSRKFDLALSHGSTDLPLVARLSGVRSVTMFDYEFATVQHTLNCRLASRVIVPDLVPAERLDRFGARKKLRQYPGLKEEYYLADFEPDAAVLADLGLNVEEPLVVLRTPPDVSLYHRFENDLFAELLQRLTASDAQVVALPRTDGQRRELQALDADNFTVPNRAIDAQSLIAFADLVVGAGGTMNREAVALGTPVYTSFVGRLGAVDESLIASGRLKLLDDLGAVRIEKKPTQEGRPRRDPQVLIDLLF